MSQVPAATAYQHLPPPRVFSWYTCRAAAGHVRTCADMCGHVQGAHRMLLCKCCTLSRLQHKTLFHVCDGGSGGVWKPSRKSVTCHYSLKAKSADRVDPKEPDKDDAHEAGDSHQGAQGSHQEAEGWDAPASQGHFSGFSKQAGGKVGALAVSCPSPGLVVSNLLHKAKKPQGCFGHW